MSERAWWFVEPSALSVTAQLDEWYDRQTRKRLDRPLRQMFGGRVYYDGSPEDYAEARRFLERAVKATALLLSEDTYVDGSPILLHFAAGCALCVFEREHYK